ncbi:U-box domain-containing protein 12 isoform X3 [Elaeis guineensis]|uniref:RING-type E3 ubiquitin transferase n=1 Tax=Elaeis guineensis var. tenera TaxID=51953 RepID=A0A6I9S9K5_ELAGV|nr:U-box domain-containing protein 12 isoform X3 [Elaeis guineensis]
MGPTTDGEKPENGSDRGGIGAVEAVSTAVAEIAGLPESRGPLRRLCCDLARRVKLLGPLFDELRDGGDGSGGGGGGGSLGEFQARALASLHGALVEAKDLLVSVDDGSRLSQALQREQFVGKFLEVTEHIEKALSEVSYDKLDISEEVKEQIELVHAQFQRAKGKIDPPDLQLLKDLNWALCEKHCDPIVLKRISEKLQLTTINDMKKESVALHEMVISSGGEPEECLEEMSSLLRKLKDCVIVENPTSDTFENKTSSVKHRSPIIPDDFRCPISLELMTDPVIVSTGQKLKNGNQDEQRAAAGELRLLAKRNADNRVCIAEAGAIPFLVELLSSPDPRTQEHAVTALLNLSINDSNKGHIVNARAIPRIVGVLQNGSMETRENAAATLFSLSVVDENKVTIGAAGAIPALINLLCQGSLRGKKDAATALFNLCIYQGNKVKAVKAGIVEHLMRLLADPSGGMMDEALAILAILAGNSDGKIAIALSEPIPVLVEVMRSGSPRNRENAAAVLWSLCTGDVQQLRAAREFGAEEALKELTETGTDRAKRKAGSLLELMHQTLEA